MTAVLFALVVLIGLVAVLVSASIRVLREYERAVVFRLGRLLGEKGPGLILLIPGVGNRMLREFLEYLRLNRNASDHTVAAYDSDISQFLAFAAEHLHRRRPDLDPSDLQLTTIRAFMAELYKQGQSRSSVARKLSALRTFVRFLKREGLIESDPAALAVSPRREIKVPAHLSEHEMSRLLETPDTTEPLGRRDKDELAVIAESAVGIPALRTGDAPPYIPCEIEP